MRTFATWIGRSMVLLLMVLGLNLAVASNRVRTSDYNRMNDQCISCHTQTFNLGIGSRTQHAPFFERRCIICHLESVPEVLGYSAALNNASEVASAARQETLRRNRRIVVSSAAMTLQHAVVLAGLRTGSEYRFRIVLNPLEIEDGHADLVSDWFPLLPEEIRPVTVEDNRPTRFPIPKGKFYSLVPHLELQRNDRSSVSIRWETSGPTSGRVEFEEVEEICLADGVAAIPPDSEVVAARPGHPQLRNLEALTIDACFLCHTPGDIGASHPVGIFARNDETIIPATLPTIREGMITCVTCHDPHGATDKHIVRETVKIRMCAACHDKVELSFQQVIY